MKAWGSRLGKFLPLALLLVFIGLKIPALGLPYFWDELGVYTRASYYLAQNGLGLLPSQLPPELSRGHPMLFYFIFGCAYKLLGLNVYVGHILALSISVMLLASLYYILTKVSNTKAALSATVLLAAQPVFYAQAVMVLPEMTLALFTLWSLYSFYRQHFVRFALFACLAILIKESAVTIPVTVTAWVILNWFFNPDNRKYFSLQIFVCVLSQFLVFGLFLLIQKQQNGWYFFPQHIDEVSFGYDRVIAKISTAYHFLFYTQGRNLWILILIAGAAMAALKAKLKNGYSFILLALVFVATYLSFCCVNFYMDRYLLVALPFITALVIMALKELNGNVYFISAVTILFVAAAASQLQPDRFNYDCDMSYTKVLLVEQQAGNYIDRNISNRQKVVAGFPMNLVLFSPNTGFNLSHSYALIMPGPGADYLVEDIETGPVNLPHEQYTLLKEFKSGFAEVKIWKKKTGTYKSL